MTKICQAKLDGEGADFKFEFQKMGIDYSEWNEIALEKKKNLTYKEAKKLFTTTRETLFKFYEQLMKIPENEELEENSLRRLSNIMNLWQHDKLHLEKGGLTLDF